MTTGTQTRQVRLALGDLDRLRITVRPLEYMSVLGMTADVVARLDRGVPPPWRKRIDQVVTAAGRRAIEPIGAPGLATAPDCILPLRHTQRTDLSGTLDVIRSAEPGEISDNLAAEFGETAPAPWRPATTRPREWINDYSDAADAVAGAIRGLTVQAQPLMEREVERVGRSVVSGTLPTLMTNLNSRIGFADGCLTFSHAASGQYDLAGRTLVLVPIVSGDRMLLTHFDDPDYVWVAYPVPGMGRLWDHRSPTPADDPLTCLLGVTRAQILHLLDRPCTMSELAAALGCLPAKATVHCDRLESSGLISRNRYGRSVQVSRTELGASFLDLYLG